MNVIKQILFLITLGLTFQSPILAMKRKTDANCIQGSPEWKAQKSEIYEIIAQQDTLDEEESSEESDLPDSLKKKKMNDEDAEKHYQKLVKKYKRYENKLKNVKDLYVASIWGGIDYTMSLDEMKERTKEIFAILKKNNLIISKEDFQTVKHNYYIPAKPQADLTRIWGAEYLKGQIKQSQELQESYDVPSYIIVAENPNDIEVQLYLGDEYCPVVRQLTNAKIYFEKIDGRTFSTPKRLADACSEAIGHESGICYVDFADKGNIIIKKGKYFIVDTEHNSFDYNHMLKLCSPKLPNILRYAWKKFKYINAINDYWYAYTIDLK